MAFESGTATNYRDLLDKVRLFLTTNAALVSAGQAWTQLRWTSDATSQELLLRAPGLAGLDEIYCGIRSYQDLAADSFNFACRGYTGYVAGVAFASQPGASGERHLSLWNAAIPYWLVANGRRMILAAKVSSRYMWMHLGFITPYARPNQLVYPFLLTGNADLGGYRWSACVTNWSTLIRRAENDWNASFQFWPSWPPDSRYLNMGPAPGDVYPLTAILAWETGGIAGTPKNIYGEIDGLFHVNGQNNPSENIVVVNGVNHLVIQDVANAGVGNYVALRLQ